MNFKEKFQIRISCLIFIGATVLYLNLSTTTAQAKQESQITIPIEAKLVHNTGTPKSIRLVGGFSPNYIEVRQGQEVTLKLTSRDGKHSLAIPAYHVRSSEVALGEWTSVTFLANVPGEFEIQCAAECGTFHPRMKGTLVVK